MSEGRILITGANGFVGNNLVSYLNKKYKVIAISRYKVNLAEITINTQDFFERSGFNEVKEFKPNYIIHAAAEKNHLFNKLLSFKNQENFNEKFTNRLIELFLYLDCKRFIFISTIGIYGSKSKSKEIINERSKIKLENNYAKSKFYCEKLLKNKLRKQALIILRPTIIYGQMAKGNIKTLVKFIDKEIPLPLKDVNNKRSLLYIGNLVSLISLLLEKKFMVNNEFVISDKEEVSTSNLVKNISECRSKRILFFKLPKFLYNLFAKIPIINLKIDQLFGSYRVNSSLIRKELKWEQPFMQDDAIKNSFTK